MSKAKELDTIIKLVGKVDPSVSKAMREAQSIAGTSSSNIKKYFAAATAAVATATAAAAVKSVKAYAAYEETVNKVSTIADTTAVSIESLSDAALELSNQTGVAAGDINEAVYQAISAGTKTTNAIDMVNRSVKLAKGGFTDTTTAVDTLTTVMNAYRLSADKVGSVSDILITTQNLGKTTVNDLAASIGNVIPVASAYGVQLDNLSSALAILTQNGISTDEAVTDTKAMLNELADAGSNVAKVLKSKTGKSFSELTASGYSIGDVLKVVGDSVDGNTTAFSNLWGNVRSGVGALSLLNSGTGKYNDVLKQMQDSAGATDKAYQKMEESTSTRAEKLKNKLSNIAIRAGEDLLPVVDTILEKLENVDIDRVMNNVTNALNWIINNGGTVITVAGEIAGAMVAWKAGLIISKVAGAIRKAQAAEEGLSVAQAALNLVMGLSPLGRAIIIITAVTAALTILYKKSEGFRNLIDSIWSKMKAFATGGIPGLISSFTGGGKSTVTVSSKASSAVTKYASGGTVTKPHLAIVGDAKETIVPHGNTPHNRALLKEAAAGVGASGSRVVQFIFSPTIHGGSAEISKAVDDGYEKFKEYARELRKEQEAVTFG